jgi:hypothetical protein
MKSVLEQTKDQIIVGSHSVTIPIKAFHIIYRDFNELQKRLDIIKLILTKDRNPEEMTPQEREVLRHL